MPRRARAEVNILFYSLFFIPDLEVKDFSDKGIPRNLWWKAASGADLIIPAWKVFGCRPAKDRSTSTTTTLAPIPAVATNLHQLLYGGGGGGSSSSSLNTSPGSPSTSNGAPSYTWSAADIGLPVLTPAGIVGLVLSTILGVFIR